MAKEAPLRRFGPERWVTLRETGEHVQVEAWSTIATAYRVRLRNRSVILVPEGDLDDLPVHPEADRGRHWKRCAAARCGAPLTPGLAICPTCKGPTCACGRCLCVSAAAAKRADKTPRKPRVKKAEKKLAVTA